MSLAPSLAVDNDDIYRLLIEQVIAGNGLPAVVRMLADVLDLSATVADEDFRPLHAFTPGGQQLSPEEAAPADSLPTRLTFDLTHEPRASTAPPTARERDVAGTEYAVAPIVLPTGVVGYIWVSGPVGSLSHGVEAAVGHAAAACTVEMVRQRALIEGESRVRNSFLEDLLAGDITSVTATRRRAKFLGYELRGEQMVFILDMDQFLAYIARHNLDEAGIQRLKGRFRRAVDASIPAIWSRTLLWEHSDSIVVLATAGKDDTPTAVTERVEALRAAVERRLEGPSISAGIGRIYADLTKLRQSYGEAEHALRIGGAIAGPSATSAFERLGAYRLLYYLRDQPELETFCDETIGDLVRYDAGHGSHLLETLRVLLEFQGNLSQTARALHLHRNGLLYRLSRIEKIGGCDLSNPSQRLALQIALLAQPLLHGRNVGRRPAPNGDRR